MKPERAIPALVAAVTVLVATHAGAHDAGYVAGEGGGSFATGLLHPVFGWDHVAAMIAVGLWGALLGAPAVWVVPVAFPLVMALGGAAAIAGVPLPGVEAGIAFSALAIGLMVAAAARPPIWIAAALVAFFAVFHGHAHGVEMPASADAAAYAAGFVLGTGLVHLGGISIGLVAGTEAGRLAVRGMGAAIAAAGFVFVLGALS